jgi:hypothetical protein
MDPLAAVPQGNVVSVGALIRHRRLVQRTRADAAATAALREAAAEFRARAAEEVAAGRPELARPFLDEAEMFESAASPGRGL